MTRSLKPLFSVVLAVVSFSVPAGATIPAPAEGAAIPYAASASLAVVRPPSTVQPAPAAQLQPDPAAWAARMVHACVKVGNRMSC